MKIDGKIDDEIDVQLAVRSGSSDVSFSEIWKISALTR